MARFLAAAASGQLALLKWRAGVAAVVLRVMGTAAAADRVSVAVTTTVAATAATGAAEFVIEATWALPEAEAAARAAQAPHDEAAYPVRQEAAAAAAVAAATAQPATPRQEAAAAAVSGRASSSAAMVVGGIINGI